MSNDEKLDIYDENGNYIYDDDADLFFHRHQDKTPKEREKLWAELQARKKKNR